MEVTHLFGLHGVNFHTGRGIFRVLFGPSCMRNSTQHPWNEFVLASGLAEPSAYIPLTFTVFPTCAQAFKPDFTVTQRHMVGLIFSS